MIASRLLRSLLLVCACAGAQPSADPTITLIDQRLAELRAGDAGAAAGEVLQLYEAARESLIRADSLVQTATDYIQALTTAPAEEAAIRERLDQPDPAPDITEEITGLSLGELQSRLSLARIELSEASTRLTELDRQITSRESDAAAIRARLAEITRQSSEFPQRALSIDPAAMPSLAEAREWRVAAERLELNAERRALEARLTSMPARYALIAAQRTEQSVAVMRLTETLRQMENRATELGFSELSPELIGIDAEDPAYAVAIDLIERDRDLRAELEVLTERLTQVRLQLSTITARTRALEEDASNARRAAEFAAGSDMLGRVLLSYWNNLSAYHVDPPSRRMAREVSETVLSRLGHESELSSVTSARAYIDAAFTENLIDAATVDESGLSSLVDLARSYRDQLRDAIATESDYIEQLTALDVASASLTQSIEDYRRYLESLILWAPTRAVIWEAELSAAPAEIRSMRTSFSNMRLVFSMTALLALGGFLVLLVGRTSLSARLEALNEPAQSEGPDRNRNAFFALLLVALRAAALPLLLVAMAAATEDPNVGVGLDLSEGLEIFALLFFILESLRILAAPNGAGVRYLGWTRNITQQAEPELRWLTRRWLPIAAVAVFAVLTAPVTGDVIVSRIAILGAAGFLAVHLLTGLARRSRETSMPWHSGTINRCALAALGILALLVIGVVLGRGISVTVLTSAAFTTICVLAGMLVVHGLASSWLKSIRDRLREDRENSVASAQEVSASSKAETQHTDWASIESRAQQLISFAVIAVGLVIVFLLWRPWLIALASSMDVVLLASETTIDGQLVSSELTLRDLIGAGLVLALTVLAARRLPPFLEIVLSGRTKFSTGARYAISTLTNYLIIGAGVITALSLLGLDWAQLRWLVAALGVGIGFGLQEIVANFISGLIILFERPIRVGDIVTIGSQAGQVTRIRIRATTIKDWDGKEILVPNKDLITGQLTNWTLTDSTTRIVIPIGIAYGSDVDKAIELVSDVLSSHPDVLEEPPPSVLFTGFGDNSLNLVARCFVADVTQRLVTVSALHLGINKVLNEAGIVIAFPQRDVHIDAQAPFRVVLDTDSKASPGQT